MKYAILPGEPLDLETGIVVCLKNNGKTTLTKINQIKILSISETTLKKLQLRHTLDSISVFSLPSESDSCLIESKCNLYSFKIHCKLPAKNRKITGYFNPISYKYSEITIKTPDLLLSQNVLLDAFYTSSQILLNQLDTKSKDIIRLRPYTIGNVNPHSGHICFGPGNVRSNSLLSLKEAYNLFWTAPFTEDYRQTPSGMKTITLKQIKNFGNTRSTSNWTQIGSDQYMYCNQHVDAVLLLDSNQLPNDVIKFESIFRNNGRIDKINFSFGFVRFVPDKNVWSVIVPANFGLGYGFTLKTLLTNSEPKTVVKKVKVKV